jgi:hypothetical protein
MTIQRIDENDLVHLIITNQASGKTIFKQLTEDKWEKVAESLIYRDDPVGTIYMVVEDYVQ